MEISNQPILCGVQRFQKCVFVDFGFSQCVREINGAKRQRHIISGLLVTSVRINERSIQKLQNKRRLIFIKMIFML
jgi:hypothetical protein